MIKEASFRKFVFHPNRDDVQQEFNRLSNYITRESNCVYHEVKKRKGHQHKRGSHRNFYSSGSPRQLADVFDDSIELQVRQLLRSKQATEETSRQHRYLEEPQVCYKENQLKLPMQYSHCPLENEAFSRTFSRPTNHRLVKCFVTGRRLSPKRQQQLPSQSPHHNKTQPNQQRSNFNTFNKLLRTRMFRDRSNMVAGRSILS